MTDDAPLYLRVKRHIADRIADGTLGPHDRIPSEHALVRALGVSRMTVNRALRELVRDGLILRIQGVGSFVAAPQTGLGLVEIRAIADDVRAAGRDYRCEPLVVRAERPPPATAIILSLEPTAPAFHAVCVHHEDEQPIQIEDRWVAPALVPDFLAQDFRRIPPTDYLKAVLPATEVEHTVEAIRPDAEIVRLLRVAPDQPCLRLTRITWNHGRPVTHARMTHPGDRFRLSGRFRPEA